MVITILMVILVLCCMVYYGTERFVYSLVFTLVRSIEHAVFKLVLNELWLGCHDCRFHSSTRFEKEKEKKSLTAFCLCQVIDKIPEVAQSMNENS